MRREWNRKWHHDETQFRVWPDGTVQCVEDGEPYAHMSDDFALIWALYEGQALRTYHRIEREEKMR